MKNLVVSIPDAAYASLEVQAQAVGRSVESLALEAIEELLKREQIRAEIRAFAEEYAGTEWDYDPEWIEAGLDSLRRLYAEEEAEERENAASSANLSP